MGVLRLGDTIGKMVSDINKAFEDIQSPDNVVTLTGAQVIGGEKSFAEELTCENGINIGKYLGNGMVSGNYIYAMDEDGVKRQFLFYSKFNDHLQIGDKNVYTVALMANGQITCRGNLIPSTEPVSSSSGTPNYSLGASGYDGQWTALHLRGGEDLPWVRYHGQWRRIRSNIA